MFFFKFLFKFFSESIKIDVKDYLMNEKKIAEGSFGQIFLAADKESQAKQFAIKVVSTSKKKRRRHFERIRNLGKNRKLPAPKFLSKILWLFQGGKYEFFWDNSDLQFNF